MKKKNEKTNKIVSTLYYFTAVCFYIISIINFVNKDNNVAVIYLCLGSSFLCFGSVWLNKTKDEDKNKK